MTTLIRHDFARQRSTKCFYCHSVFYFDVADVSYFGKRGILRKKWYSLTCPGCKNYIIAPTETALADCEGWSLRPIDLDLIEKRKK